MFLHKVPKFITWIYRDYTWHKDRYKREIFLTFDDGPVPGVTDYVLDQLQKFDMKATFFMVGENIEKYPDLARMVVEQGQGIGNHTYNHLRGTHQLDQVYLENIQCCQNTIESTFQQSTHLFRPPYGRLKWGQKRALLRQFDIVFWDVLAGDFVKGLSPFKALTKLRVFTENGSIVLFHDQLKSKEFLNQMLPDYLGFLKAEGYKTGLL